MGELKTYEVVNLTTTNRFITDARGRTVGIPPAPNKKGGRGPVRQVLIDEAAVQRMAKDMVGQLSFGEEFDEGQAQLFSAPRRQAGTRILPHDQQQGGGGVDEGAQQAQHLLDKNDAGDVSAADFKVQAAAILGEENTPKTLPAITKALQKKAAGES